MLLKKLKKPEGLYGLEILQLINAANKKNGRSEAGVGTLYPSLKRLEEDKLICGRWADEKPEETSTGARRRYYSITPDGEKVLEAIRNYRKDLRFFSNSPLPEPI